VPKTYNSRQIEQFRLEAQSRREPAEADTPDVTPYIRFFPAYEARAIADRIDRLVAARKVTRLQPETAHLAAKAIRSWAATPRRDWLVQAICRLRPICEKRCVACIGVANAIMRLYRGEKLEER
jgi:hypothetical protein